MNQEEINNTLAKAKEGNTDAYADLYLIYSNKKYAKKSSKLAQHYYKKAYEGHSLKLLLINIDEYLGEKVEIDGEPCNDNVKIWLVQYLMNPASGDDEYLDYYIQIREKYKDKFNFKALQELVLKIHELTC